MELYNVLKSLNVDELKTVKKIATDLIKEKQPKKVSKTREDKIKEVHTKLKTNTYGFNYHELMYAFEIICRNYSYPITVNLKNEIAFVKRAFGEKPKEGFGEYEIEIITRYVFSYSQLYKSETYPYPTLKGLSQPWIINKIKNLVDIDNSKKQITELSNEVF